MVRSAQYHFGCRTGELKVVDHNLFVVICSLTICRDMSYHSTKENEVRSIDDLKRNGICMTDTGVMNSKLPFAGDRNR